MLRLFARQGGGDGNYRSAVAHRGMSNDKPSGQLYCAFVAWTHNGAQIYAELLVKLERAL